MENRRNTNISHYQREQTRTKDKTQGVTTMARNMAIECKSIEDSCKELHVWMGRLGKLCHRDKKDLKAYFLKKNIWVDSLENLGYYMESGAESSIYSSPNQKEEVLAT